jgi:hypothetical protein
MSGLRAIIAFGNSFNRLLFALLTPRLLASEGSLRKTILHNENNFPELLNSAIERTICNTVDHVLRSYISVRSMKLLRRQTCALIEPKT